MHWYVNYPESEPFFTPMRYAGVFFSTFFINTIMLLSLIGERHRLQYFEILSVDSL